MNRIVRWSRLTATPLVMVCVVGLALGIDWRADSPLTPNLNADVVPARDRMLLKWLTGEHARAALAEMLKTLRVRDPGVDQVHFFHSIDPDQMAQAPIKDNLERTCSVERFKIDLKTASYAVEFGNLCRYHYSGTFEWKGGRWNASPPNSEGVFCYK